MMNDALYIELGERAYRGLDSQGWQIWAVGLSRCPMCVGLPCADFRAQCDCFWDEPCCPIDLLPAVTLELGEGLPF